jgi:hypothetical protein
MVTGFKHRLEFKHVDTIRVMNFIRLFVTGNQDWLVPAGFNERRFAVFDVGEGKLQDYAYFAAIDAQMDSGGREALLHHLLSFDLSSVNLRAIPRTQALLEQQIASLTTEQSWWLDVLRNGQLPPTVRIGDADVENSCLRGELYDSYVRHGRRQGVSRRSIETKLGRFLSNVVGEGLQNLRVTRAAAGTNFPS